MGTCGLSLCGQQRGEGEVGWRSVNCGQVTQAGYYGMLVNRSVCWVLVGSCRCAAEGGGGGWRSVNCGQVIQAGSYSMLVNKSVYSHVSGTSQGPMADSSCEEGGVGMWQY